MSSMALPSSDRQKSCALALRDGALHCREPFDKPVLLSDLVLLGGVALGADEDADDAGVAVAGRRVQRRVPVVVLDVRTAAAQ